MDLDEKIDCTGSYAGQMASVQDAETLKSQAARLKEQHLEEMLAGNVEKMLETRAQLEALSPLIFATEIAELRRGIDECSARLVEIRPEVEYLEGVRGDRNKLLAEKIKEHEAAQLAVNKVEVALYAYDNEAEIVRERRRTLQEKLDAFIKDANRIVGEIK